MRSHELVSTAPFEESLRQLAGHPEAGLLAEVLVAYARVRPTWGKPAHGPWRALKTRAYGTAPSLLLLYLPNDGKVWLGPVRITSDETPPADVADGRDPQPFLEWLNGGNAAAEAALDTMLALPEAEWPSWIAAHPEAQTFHFLEQLATEAYATLLKAPRRTLALAQAALPFVDAAAIPHRYRHLLLFLHGRLLRELANALRHTGDPRKALQMYERSIEVLESFAPVLSEPAASYRGAALARYKINKHDPEARRVLQKSIDAFTETLEWGELLIARMYEVLMAFDLDENETADAAAKEAVRLATLLGDEKTLAQAENALGQCAQKLGRLEESSKHLQAAIALMKKHEMTAELPHATWGFAWVIADQKATNWSLATFKQAAAEFLEVGKPLFAAEVELDAMKILLRAERYDEIIQSASALIDLLANSGLTSAAQEALNTLHEAALARQLSEEKIEWVRGVLSEQ